MIVVQSTTFYALGNVRVDKLTQLISTTTLYHILREFKSDYFTRVSADLRFNSKYIMDNNAESFRYCRGGEDDC